ncbi:MAG: ATP-binding cassette domain-containing protein [Sporichthyaceae bacterium]
MIEVCGVTKRYGERVAVANLSFTVPPGTVTGFLGPNGAGKSTTMRMIAGLDAPTSGWVRVNGRHYRRTRAPLAELGILLEAKAVHQGRSAFHHLLAVAQTNGIGKRRVDEVVDLVGLREVARKRAGGFSLGMGQRLGIASALLGDPATVVLDEPVNGLDPEGIRWVRELLRHLADQGRTVFISSHLMSEMALTATRLIVIGRGRLIADTTVEEFIAAASADTVRVRSPQARELAALLSEAPVQVETDGLDPHVLTIRGMTSQAIGDLAHTHRIALHELGAQQASLEDAFMALTAGAVEYHAGPVPAQRPAGQASGPTR